MFYAKFSLFLTFSEKIKMKEEIATCRPATAGKNDYVEDQSLTYVINLQEHKHLLKILFANELQKSQCAPFKWNGEFSKEVGS